MKLYRINALLLKYCYITKNRFDRLFDIFYWPVVNMVLWGFTSLFIEGISEYNIMSMFLGGMILWVFTWRAAQDIGIFVLEDFWSRNLYHLFSSPVKITEHIVSIIVFGIGRSIITFFILTFVAFSLYQFNMFTISPIFIGLAVGLLSLFGWIMGLFIASVVFRYGQRIQVLTWSLVFLIQPFSCVFYPLSALPSWAAFIAKLLPTTYIFESFRSALFQNTIDYASLLYTFCLELFLLFLVALFLGASFKKAKTSGLLAKGD